ncbi:hypothetical protein ACJIZ3_016967 [Penstemon smallii]|uniref:Uncharacterized protein n=1 Tax=Penstemon smallii TaxID=265156 RepID=A0ABD3SUN7_9LAMI
MTLVNNSSTLDLDSFYDNPSNLEKFRRSNDGVFSLNRFSTSRLVIVATVVAIRVSMLRTEHISTSATKPHQPDPLSATRTGTPGHLPWSLQRRELAELVLMSHALETFGSEVSGDLATAIFIVISIFCLLFEEFEREKRKEGASVYIRRKNERRWVNCYQARNN